MGSLVSSQSHTHNQARAFANLVRSAWILVAEVWPMSSRAYGIALGASSNWMNNFIVGQVTPDMLTGMKWGTFLFFGIIIIIGAGFIWFFGEPSPFIPPPLELWNTNKPSPVPETKNLTLEEMDLIFGSSGVAAADKERMAQINREIGLTEKVHGSVSEPSGGVMRSEKEALAASEQHSD